MKTRDTEYMYATSRVRALEKGLLDQGTTDRLIEAANLEDMAKILTELGYTELQTASATDIERSLFLARRDTFNLISEISPMPEICDIFRLRYDYHNVKAIIKSEASGEDAKGLLIDAGRYEVGALSTIMRQMEYKELPPSMKDAIEDARETLARTNDAQLCDFILDRAYFNELRSKASESKSAFLQGYVSCMIDAANLRALLRSMRQKKDSDFLAQAIQSGGKASEDKLLQALCGEITIAEAFSGTLLESAAENAPLTGSMVAFERECDDAIMGYLRSARYVAFGEAPLIAFVAAREADVMAIRIILAGKLQDLPNEEIRERLRASYV